MDVKIEPTWKQQLGAEFDKPYFATLAEQVRQAYRMGPCFPPSRLVFNAFNLCPFNEVKVVIMGQDPYHEPGQAMGLSFSVPKVLLSRLHFRIFLKKFRLTWGSLCPRVAT